MKVFDETPWIQGDESLGSALEVLTIATERTVFVLTEDQKLLGVITEGDVTRAYVRGQIRSTLASDIMNQTPVHFESPLSDSDLATIFVGTGILLVPIVDVQGKLIGSQSTRSAVERILTQQSR